MPPWTFPFQRSAPARPLTVDADARPLPAPLQEAIVRVWLHAMDGDGRARRESRRLVRLVAAELGISRREARARVEGALRGGTSMQALRDALGPAQRVRLLASSYELARANGRAALFDRVSAPLLARWLGLSGEQIASARVPEPSRLLPRRPRWRAA